MSYSESLIVLSVLFLLLIEQLLHSGNSSLSLVNRVNLTRNLTL